MSKVPFNVVDHPTKSYISNDKMGKSGGNGGGSDMEARIAKLEDFVIDARDRLVKIETKLDQTATKSDLHENSNAMIRWVVGTAFVLGAAAVTVMTFVLNNATPKNTAQTQPIIVQVPTYLQPPQQPQIKK